MADSVESSEITSLEFKREISDLNKASTATILASEKNFQDYKISADNDLSKIRKEAEREVKLAQVDVLNIQVAAQEEISAQLQKQEVRLSDYFKARIEELENTAKTAKQSLELSHYDAAVYSNREAELLQEISQYKEQFARQELNLNTVIAAANNDKNDFASAIHELRSTSQKQEEEYQSKIDILNDNFIEMKNNGEEMQNKNKSLEDEVKSLQGLLKMMESDNTKSNNEVTIMQMNLENETLFNEKLALEVSIASMQNYLKDRDEKDAEENEHRLSFVSANATLFEEKEMELLSAISDKGFALEKCDALSAEIIRLQLRNDEVECKYISSMELSSLNKEVTESVQAIANVDINDQFEKIVKERDNLLSRCALLEDQMSTLQYEIDINGSSGEIIALKEQLVETEKELDAAMIAMKVSDESVHLLKQECGVLRSTSNSQVEGNGTRMVAVDEYLVRIAELEEVITVQNKGLCSLQESVDELQFNKEANGESSDIVESNKDKMLLEAESRVCELQATVASLENDLSSMKDSQKAQNELLITERNSLSESNLAVTVMRDEYEDMKGKVLTLESALKKAEDVKISVENALRITLEEQSVALDDAQNMLESVQDECAAKTEECLVLTNQLETERIRKCEVESEREIELERLSSTSMSIQEIVQTNATLFEEKEMELLSAVSDKGFALEKCDALSAEIIRLQARNDEVECKYDAMKEDSNQVKLSTESVSIDFSQLQLKYDSLYTELELSNLAQTNLQMEKVDSKKMILDLEQSNISLRAAMDNSLQGKDSELINLQDALIIAEKNLEEIKKDMKENMEIAENNVEVLRTKLSGAEIVSSNAIKEKEMAMNEVRVSKEKYEKLLSSIERNTMNEKETVEIYENRLKEINIELKEADARVEKSENDLQCISALKDNLQTELDDSLFNLEIVRKNLNINVEEKIILEENFRTFQKNYIEMEQIVKNFRNELKQQSKAMSDLEENTQEKIIENATLRDDLRNSLVRFKEVEETYLRCKEDVRTVRAELIQVIEENESKVSDNVRERNILMEEIEHYRASFVTQEKKEKELDSLLSSTRNELQEKKIVEAEFLGRLIIAEEAGKKIAEAEEALARVEDKKKKDLVNLKKQNERISAVQVIFVIFCRILSDCAPGWPSLYLTIQMPVYLFFYLSVCVCVCVCLSIYLSIYLFVCLSFYSTLHFFICVSIYLSVCVSVCLCVFLSVCLSVCLSIYLSVYLSIYLSVCESVCLSVCLCVRLSVNCLFLRFLDYLSLYRLHHDFDFISS